MDKTNPEKAMKELTMLLMYLSRFNETFISINAQVKGTNQKLFQYVLPPRNQQILTASLLYVQGMWRRLRY